MHQDFHIGRRIIVHLADFDLAFVACTDNGFNQFGGVRAKRYFGNGKGLVIQLAYFSADFYCTTPFAIIVTAHINGTSRLKIGEKNKRFPFQMCHTRIQQFVEVMRQNF